MEDMILAILQARYSSSRLPGKVLFIKDGMPIVICGEGMLKITEAIAEDSHDNRDFIPVSKFRLRFE